MVRYVGRDATMVKEADVVRSCERVQLQGDIHLVQLLPREGDRKWKDDVVGLHHRAQENSGSYPTMLELGVHEIISRFMH